MTELILEVVRRPETGKNAARRTRAAGMVPAVVYGGELETLPVAVDRRKFAELFKKGGGVNAIFLLKLEGGKQQRHTMIRHMDVDPTTRRVLHLDFQRIRMTDAVKVTVPVHLVGTAFGVKNEGGLLDFVTRELEVECLPTAIPAAFELDVSDLKVGEHREAGDLSMPKGVKLLDDADRVIVSLVSGRLAAEEEAAASELLESAPQQPEVVARGKAASEEED